MTKSGQDGDRDVTQGAIATLTPASITIGSGETVYSKQFSPRGAAVNLAGVTVDFAGSDPANAAKLSITDASFNGANLSAGTEPGGVVAAIVVRGLVVDTGSIVTAGNPGSAGSLTITLTNHSGFVQDGGVNVFNGGSLTVAGHTSAVFINNSTIDSTGGSIEIQTDLSGTGTIIDSPNVRGESGHVSLGGVVEAGETVDMSGAFGILNIAKPLQFLGTVSGFGGLDTIDIRAGHVTTAMYDAHGDLLLFHNNGQTDSLLMVNPASTLYVNNIGDGGVSITAAPFGQHSSDALVVHTHAIG